MKRKNKGFTLIELLAVIVILGLLMAIAIPSVTKYITQSRKKTVSTTIDNYMSALTNQVNDMEYVFTGTNTIYAVPIECIALERGGTNPFGEWLHANSKYWAYVLVQYDDKTSSYTYGFTFKDSAGYGLYPTTSEKLNESGKQIQQDLSLNKPLNGLIENVTAKENWIGFNVDENTSLHVLEAADDGVTGDGVDTCTLCQKGSNYETIKQEEENENNKPESELPMLNSIMNIYNSGDVPFFYSNIDKIKSITFENSINIPNGVETYDFSSTKNGKIMSFLRNHATENGYYDLVIQGDGAIYANPDSSYLFSVFSNVTKINNISLLNTSRVTNMKAMFSHTNINNLNLSSWDTRNVTDMSEMFKAIGVSGIVSLTLGFDTSNVTNMSGMFDYVDDIDSNRKITFQIDLGNKFNTSKVTNMRSMFSGIGMFNDSFVLDLGDKFDTSNVTDMSYMFSGTGYFSNSYTLILGDKFDTSKVTNMDRMFVNVGRGASTLSLNLGNKFNTKNVKNMDYMFKDAGLNSNNWSLDCSMWNVDSVTSYSNFNGNVETKVIPPKWKK